MSRKAPVPPPRSSDVPSWAEQLVRLLDDGFRIPGTSIRFGWDGILGFLLPEVGDALGSLASLAILWLGFKERVPKAVLVRMVLNVGIDALVGLVPVLGDLFDVAYKANRRNLSLVERHRGNPQAKPGLGDYLLIGLGLLAALAIALLPFLVIAWIVSLLRDHAPW